MLHLPFVSLRPLTPAEVPLSRAGGMLIRNTVTIPNIVRLLIPGVGMLCCRAVCLLKAELEKCEKESAELQEYANTVLQQIADHCPDILEQVVNALEESS
ncbi:UNVERIFIED_CONTAM: hypothetical protein FKN15_060478 [Acipenser sinensis]